MQSLEAELPRSPSPTLTCCYKERRLFNMAATIVVICLELPLQIATTSPKACCELVVIVVRATWLSDCLAAQDNNV